MKKKFLVCVFGFQFFLLTALIAVAPGVQTLVPADSWVYDAFADLYIESGKVAFTGNPPLSIAELKLYLREIDYDSLSNAGRAIYNQINSYFNQQMPGFQSGLLSAGAQLQVALEGYVKSNSSMPWNYAYQKRPAFFNAPMGFSVGDYLTLHMDLALKQNVETMLSSDTFCNIPLSADQFSLEFPQWTYGNLGVMLGEATGINLKVARGPQYIGRTLTGSIIISEYSSSETWVEATVFSPKFKFALNVTELNPSSKQNPDPAYFYHHRLEFRLFDKLTFTLMEGALVNAPFELRFLNPLMIFHGYASWRDYYGTGSNGEEESQKEASLLGIVLDFVPCSGVRLYGLFAMNQFQTSYERKNWPDSAIPNALAFQGGTELNFAVGNGYFQGGIEGVYTTPYMYILEGKDWSYVRDYDESIGMDGVRQWVGTPFGPDTIAAAIKFGYKVPSLWSASCMYTFALQGAMANYGVLDTDYWPSNAEEASVKTPSKNATYTNTVSVCATFSPVEWIQLEIRPSCSIRQQQDKVDTSFQFSMGCKIDIL
ncbi:MAG: hypothetical protein J6B81_00215 [Spirochaetaceae bacterium]|nr:hypothetical protein [Spirochaetaceae bacterium]